ncbi:MAG TPA: hypothetical protein DEP85_06175 [Holosporales bacterium]|nr:hypothetical protein [Holosporales bacterium]
MVYHVSYDLRKPGRDYAKLYETIKKAGSTWCHPLDSTWYIVSSLDASTLRDTLKAVMDPSDALIVTKASAPGAWFGLSDKLNEWFKTNL